MIDNLLLKLDVISPILLLIASIAFIIIKKRLFSFPDLIVLTFVTSQLIFNAIAGFYQKQSINNQWVYHANCFVTELLFVFYFIKMLNRPKLVYLSTAIFVLFFIAMLAFVQSHTTFPSYAYSFGSFTIVLFAFMSFQKLIENLPATNILYLKDFWLLTGVLTYFSSSFLIFISYNYLYEVSIESVSILWRFHNLFFFISCIIYFKAIISKQWEPKL